MDVGFVVEDGLQSQRHDRQWGAGGWISYLLDHLRICHHGLQINMRMSPLAYTLRNTIDPSPRACTKTGSLQPA
jgi:hypothetical protein